MGSKKIFWGSKINFVSYEVTFVPATDKINMWESCEFISSDIALSTATLRFKLKQKS